MYNIYVLIIKEKETINLRVEETCEGLKGREEMGGLQERKDGGK